jgi:hypothetical protein
MFRESRKKVSWFRVDDGFSSHAKVLRAGNEAVGAWLRMGAEASRHLTDGYVDKVVALSITTPKVIALLVDVGLLEVREGGWALHDYLDWNPSANSIKEAREADRARKASGRRAQGFRPDSTPLSGRNPVGVRSESSRSPVGIQPPGWPESDHPVRLSSPLLSSPRSQTPTESSNARETSGRNPEQEPIKKTPNREESTLPELPRALPPLLTLDDESRAYAEQLGIRNPAEEFLSWKNRAISAGRVSCDWQAEWRAACPRIRNYQRRDRSLDAKFESPSVGPVPRDPNSPAILAERRRRDEDAEQAAREGVPPPPEAVAALKRVGIATTLPSAASGGRRTGQRPSGSRSGPLRATSTETDSEQRIRQELTPEEIEARRQEQIRRAREIGAWASEPTP